MIQMGILALVVSGMMMNSAVASQRPVESVDLVSCRENMGFDAGLLYTVSYNPQQRGYEVNVASNSIIGPRDLFTVGAREMRSGIENRLTLDFNDPRARPLRRYRLVLTHMDSAAPELQVFLNGELITSHYGFDCRRNEVTALPVIPKDRMTCMAHFTGFVYDAQSGSCQATGQSGCSSPFEFDSAETCEAAATESR